MCLWIWQPVRSQHVATAAIASATSAGAGPTAEPLYTYVVPAPDNGFLVVLRVRGEGRREAGRGGQLSSAQRGQRGRHLHGRALRADCLQPVAPPARLGRRAAATVC